MKFNQKILNPLILQMIEINSNDFEKVKKDIKEIIKELGDPLSDLYLILDNRYKMDSKAIRLITKMSMSRNWNPIIMPILDLIIYTKSTPIILREFLVTLYDANFDFETLIKA